MAYELRVPGQAGVLFETEAEAMAAARRVLLDEPDAEVEVLDGATGAAVAPGASKAWRDELKSRVGF